MRTEFDIIINDDKIILKLKKLKFLDRVAIIFGFLIYKKLTLKNYILQSNSQNNSTKELE